MGEYLSDGGVVPDANSTKYPSYLCSSQCMRRRGTPNQKSGDTGVVG